MNRRTFTLRGARIDVDDADVGAERERQVGRVVDGLGVEAALDALGQLDRSARGHGDLLDRRALLRVALDEPAALLPLEVLGRHLEHRRGDDPRPVADLARDERRRGAADRRRARPVGAEAVGRVVGVAVDHVDVLGRDPELLGDDLGERRLVALALGLDADPELRLAGRVHAQLGAVVHPEAEDVHVLARAGADRLGEERDADPHQLAALAPLPPARARSSS